MTTAAVAFLSLRQIHHTLHIAPIAFELSKREGFRVALYTSHVAAVRYLHELGAHYPGHRCAIEMLRPPRWQSLFNVKRRVYPRPKAVLRHNAGTLMAFDAIVSSDFYTLTLLDMRRGTKPLFIKTPHGAGAGAYGFKDGLSRYDLLLGPGEYFRERLEQLGIGDRSKVQVIGYPKLEIAEKIHRHGHKLFDDQRPVIVYNPHFKDRLSSWPQWGRQVLDYFFNSSRYNLVFAPHINLFSRRRKRNQIPSRYLDAPNILVDYGSTASVDMTYTRNADLYLGDVSSQVLEFISHPRPCVFLNAHALDWQDDPDYSSWRLGRVVDRIDDLDAALASALGGSDPYRSVQMDVLRRRFAGPNDTASSRAADTIALFLEEAAHQRQRAPTGSSSVASDASNVPKTSASENV